MIRGRIGRAFESAQGRRDQALRWLRGVTRFVELRAEVVVIEDEPHAQRPEEPSKEEVRIRRIAGLDDVEVVLPEDPLCQYRCASPAIGELPAVRQQSVC